MTARFLVVFGFIVLGLSCRQAVAQGSAVPPPPPPGPGLASVMARCSGCHSTSTVFGQRQSREEWEATVQLMVDRGADLSADEQGVVVDYLATNFNSKPATAQ